MARLFLDLLAVMTAMMISSSNAFSPTLRMPVGLRSHGLHVSTACPAARRSLGAVGLRSVLDATKTDHAPTAMQWEDLSKKPWGSIETDYMMIAHCGPSGEWEKGEIQPYGDLKISPRAGVLNYGQGVFEGMKAQRTEEGKIVIFRYGVS